MDSALQSAVSSLAQLRTDVQSDAPELMNEFNHLVSVGNLLATGNPTTAQISSYAKAVQNFGNTLTACDDTLKFDLISVAETIAYSINAGNPIAPLVPGNPSNPLVPYRTPCSPGGSCSPIPAPGIYWTGLFILAGMIGAAVMIGKVKS